MERGLKKEQELTGQGWEYLEGLLWFQKLQGSACSAGSAGSAGSAVGQVVRVEKTGWAVRVVQVE